MTISEQLSFCSLFKNIISYAYKDINRVKRKDIPLETVSQLSESGILRGSLNNYLLSVIEGGKQDQETGSRSCLIYLQNQF